MLQTSTNTITTRPLFRVNEILLHNFEEKVNEELLNSDSNINSDLDALAVIDTDANDFDPDVVNENENIIDGDGTEVLIDRNIVHDINIGYSFVETEDAKYYKEYLDANAIRAKHTLYLIIELIKQNNKDRLLKLNNEIYNQPFIFGNNISTIEFISNFKTILDSNGANI